MLRDVRDRQPEDGAGVQGKLREILRDHRHHAGVVRARGDFGKPHVIALDKKFHAEDAAAAEGIGDFLSVLTRIRQRGVGHRLRLP